MKGIRGLLYHRRREKFSSVEKRKGIRRVKRIISGQHLVEFSADDVGKYGRPKPFPLGKVASCATVNNGVVYLVVYVEVSRMG